MALQFVFGGAGSGKTRYLYEQAIRMSMEQPDRRYLVVVPEQYTMQAQKEIIRLHPRHGVMNIDILSFKRLAYRIFDELAVKMPVVLDDMGKSMVIRKVSATRKNGLGLYGGHLGQAGFISQLKSQLSELYQYGISPRDLGKLREQAPNPLLAQKLGDLQLIYQEFKDYIENHYITAEEILDILCRELPRSQLLKNSVIFMDGYTGFTPVQYRLVEIFIAHALDVICAVTVAGSADPYRESGIQNLFYMSKHTVCRLADMARENHAVIREDVVLDKRPAWRFKDSPALDFLEQNLYRYSGKCWKGDPGQIKLFCGQTPAEEIRYVASSIEGLVRDRGLRYRDMAVITGDLPSYGREAAHQFEQAGIPCFMDDKKSILENPMVELIRAVLEVMRDFSYESVMRYLKTGLVYDFENGEAARAEAVLMTDRLENYVRALGINGWKRWDKVWERQYRGSENLNLDELNAFRLQILEPLRPLREAMAAKGATVADVTKALETYLEAMNLREKLEEYQAYFSGRGRRGDENLAREYGQVYDLVAELLWRLTGLLGEERAERKSYTQILDAGFAEIQVGLIPATIDQVMVGDITRSRLDGVKVLFFVGVNDGVVPQKKNVGSLLNDRDREFFKSHRMELAPTAREDGCMQKFYLYLQLSKPERQLVITYAGRGADGKSLRPSVLLGEVRKLFPDLKTIGGPEVRWPVRTVRDGKELLIRGLKEYRDNREPLAPAGKAGKTGEPLAPTGEPGEAGKIGEPLAPTGEPGEAGKIGEPLAPTGEPGEKEAREEREFLALYRWFFDSPDYQREVKQLTEAAFYSYKERGIGRAAARALYGNILQGSVTRLEQYASCAYAHFLRYGLELMEREEYELEAVDMGNLFHQSIDSCFRVMKERGEAWKDLTDDGRRLLVKECVARVVENYGNTIMQSSARYAYMAGRVERMTDRTIWALAEQVKRGDFEPAGFEVSFSAVDNLKAMRIALSGTEELQLRGRIDRLDLCRDEKKLYVKIIDYKSGSTSFDLASLYYGLQLQLVVYMDAALEMEQRRSPELDVVPAGIFYYNIQDPLVDKKEPMTAEEIEQQILRQLRMNGLVNSDLEVIRHMDRDIETQSDVIPVSLKAGLIQESRSSVAGGQRFSRLKSYVNQKLQTAGREILKGEAALAPYKQGTRTACDYCPYHPVCGFDTKTAGYGYRRLKSIKPEEIWEKLEEEKNGESENGS